MVQLYLSRRNLLTLLDKLNGRKEGIDSKCTIIKMDMQHKTFPQTHSPIFITAVEDEDYYVDRKPGRMREDNKIKLDDGGCSVSLEKGCHRHEGRKK